MCVCPQRGPAYKHQVRVPYKRQPMIPSVCEPETNTDSFPVNASRQSLETNQDVDDGDDAVTKEERDDSLLSDEESEARRKRELRKSKANSVPSAPADTIRPTCGRAFRWRIGLISHRRSHRTPSST